jgi:hypothetical protein
MDSLNLPSTTFIKELSIMDKIEIWRITHERFAMARIYISSKS